MQDQTDFSSCEFGSGNLRPDGLCGRRCYPVNEKRISNTELHTCFQEAPVYAAPGCGCRFLLTPGFCPTIASLCYL